MSLFLSCIFYSMVKIRKNVLQKEIKDWTYKAYLLTEETSSWFLLIESLIVVLEFLSNRERLDCFSRYVLLKLSKVTVTCPNRTNRDSFDLPKVSKINISFEMLIIRKKTNLKSLYLQSWRNQKHHIWTAGKHHWKGCIGYSSSNSSNVISS